MQGGILTPSSPTPKQFWFDELEKKFTAFQSNPPFVEIPRFRVFNFVTPSVDAFLDILLKHNSIFLEYLSLKWKILK